MNQDEFFNILDNDFPAITTEQELLNGIVADIRNHWMMISNRISNPKRDLNVISRSSDSFNAWVEIGINDKTIKAQRIGDNVEVSALSAGVQQATPHKIYIEDGKVLFDKTNQEFKVNDIDFMLEHLLD
ncbi:MULTISPECIES: hypothetical protein [Enterococcus]|uniref:hypothetical protein n=1 Tax=Enterococcus TaxID=1350 RepID=UPI0014330384|nr:hypothetical protein [Enterococcus casseliflavus]NKD29187.1 hypothetical protein [Enterococcus casseliflavus]